MPTILLNIPPKIVIILEKQARFNLRISYNFIFSQNTRVDVADLMFRHSRQIFRHDQTFATQIRHFQTFTTKISKPFQKFETEKLSRDFRNHGWDGSTFQRKAETTRPRNNFPDQGGDGATKRHFLAAFETELETTRLSRPKQRGRDFPDQDGNGSTFQTKAKTARPRNNSSQPSRPSWRRRDFPD